MKSKESQIQRLREYLAQDPGNDGLRATLFDAALEGGDRTVAAMQVGVALERDPGNAGWRHRQATLWLAEKSYERAEAALRQLLAEGHEAPAIRINLAYALFSRGEHEAAASALAPLMARGESERSGAWVLWLRVQHRRGRLDEALELFRKVAGEVAMPPEALGVASLIATDASQLEDARRWGEAALRGQPRQPEALATCGTLALAAGDAAGALQWFGRGLELNAGDGRVWSGIAMARMLANELPEAEEAFVRAVAGIPEHVGTWIGLGWCRFLLKRLDGAREAFEQALRLDRNFGESHGGLAVVLLSQGEDGLGKRELEIALRLDRASLGARYAQAMLSGEAANGPVMLALAQRLIAERRAQFVGKKA